MKNLTANLCALTAIAAIVVADAARRPIYTCDGSTVRVGELWQVALRPPSTLCLVRPVVAPPPSDTAPTPPTPIPPPSGGHEPAGLTVISDYPMNSTGADGWTYTQFGNGSVTTIVSDATAPKSPTNVARVTFPVGLNGGSGVGQMQHSLPNVKALYVSAWLKFSSNWYANLTGNNKMLYFWMNGKEAMVTEAYGDTFNPLTPVVCPLNLGQPYPANLWPGDQPDRNLCLRPNLNTGTRTVRGQWQRYEYLLVANTPGVADGSFDAWVDGVQTHHNTGLMWAGTSWGLIQWEPIWGGGAGPLSQLQYQYVDHIYLSGK